MPASRGSPSPPPPSLQTKPGFRGPNDDQPRSESTPATARRASLHVEDALIYVADVTIDNGNVVISNRASVADERLKIAAGYPSWITDTTLQASSSCERESLVLTGIKAAEQRGVIMGIVLVSSGSYTVTFETLKPSGGGASGIEGFISPPVLRDPSNPLYVVYYAPKNPEYSDIPGEISPCIVGVHGGPTGMEPQALNWIKMLYTSQGFAWYVLLHLNVQLDDPLTG
ncbi:hypothetical protein OG21DRAFT_1489765 [Imleria badia]|nr:hypothetical protein OG21DRAFT_1489765 [Imleria badia]